MTEFKAIIQPEPPPIGATLEDFETYIGKLEQYQNDSRQLLHEVEKFYHSKFFNKNEGSEARPTALPEVIQQYDIALYEKIQSKFLSLENKPLKNCGYFCSSVDLHTPLLTTNAEIIDCFDFEFNFTATELYLDIIKIYEMHTNGSGSADLINQNTLDALQYRQTQGHFRTDLNQKADLKLLLANEILALGADLSTVQIQMKEATPILPNIGKFLEVSFDWKHPSDKEPRKRIVSFVGLDVDAFDENLIQNLWRQKNHGLNQGSFDYFIMKSAHRSKQAIGYVEKLHQTTFDYLVNHASIVLIGDQFGLESPDTNEANEEMKQTTNKISETFSIEKGWEKIEQPAIKKQKAVASYLNSVAHLLPLENSPTRIRQRTYSWLMLPFKRNR